MDTTSLTGSLVVLAAMTLIVTLTLWSRRTINALGRNGYRTLREAIKDLHGDE